MSFPRWLAVAAVATGMTLGSAGVVLAASSSSGGGDDVPRVSASSVAAPTVSVQDDSPSPSPSVSFSDDVPADVVAGLSEIPQSDAVAIAQSAVGGSRGGVERAVLKVEDGRLVWDVRFADGSKVEVDALAGVAVKVDGGGGGSRGSVEPGDDNGGNRGSAGSVEAGDDHGGNRGSAGSVEAGDDHGGSRHSGSSDEPGDDHGDNSGRDGSDD